jgi:hypothetical protein
VHTSQGPCSATFFKETHCRIPLRGGGGVHVLGKVLIVAVVLAMACVLRGLALLRPGRWLLVVALKPAIIIQ